MTSSEDNFLKILNDNKEDTDSIKAILSNNKQLINQSFDINNSINNEKYTYSPLTYSIEKKLSGLSIFLIEQGADINFKILPTEDYPILIACRNRLLEVVQKLLECEDVNINCLNKKNESCFSVSLHQMDAGIYPLLCEYANKKNKEKVCEKCQKLQEENLELISKNKLYQEKINNFEKKNNIIKENVSKFII